MIHNSKYILIGIVFFIVVFTLPFTINLGAKKYERPVLALPAGETECVAPLEDMRADHMTLLNTWRDMALREGKTEYVGANGKVWTISLQNTCMQCHANKEQFCDTCHDSNSVSPYCWDCHIEPKGVQQ